MNEIKPLNGTKTHPLSDFAREVLRSLCVSAKPCQQVNPGVVNRLMRENLIEIVQLPSPYKKTKGNISHMKITKAGRAAIDKQGDG